MKVPYFFLKMDYEILIELNEMIELRVGDFISGRISRQAIAGPHSAAT
jgi:hypothetical protein